MRNLLGIHHIPMHQTEAHREHIFRLQPPLYKVVVVGEDADISWVPPGALCLVRYHQVSENFGHRGADAFLPPSQQVGQRALRNTHDFLRQFPIHRPVVLEALALLARTADSRANPATARQCGREHADIYARIGGKLVNRGFPKERLRFSGLNEPQVWSTEPVELLAEYSIGFLERLHEFGFAGVWGCLGVGWPGNGGTKDAPPLWEWAKPVLPHLLPGDLLELHEYWGLAGPQGAWRWLAGRYQQCPLDVAILIGECGIDRGVEGVSGRGWTDLPGSMAQKAETYMAQLAAYDAELRKDKRIVAYTPFTWDGDGADWASFEMLNENMMRATEAHVAWALAQPEPSPPVPPEPPVLEYLPENEPDAPAAILAQKVRWWAEQAMRHYEGYEPLRGDEIMYSLIKVDGGLLYRLEQKLQ